MKLSLIGAGPGDPELITLKAVRLLQEADIILYDALANKAFLQYAKKEAELIYVGKRLQKHSVSQDEINRIILQNCLAGKHVLRLKGGDPIVFGRGYEEKQFVESFGIETEIVPGISSCIAAPSSADIPVTCRGISESFWVITGHTKDRGLPQDIRLAAKSNATIIILMGTAKLPEIVHIFLDEGRQDLPIAIIENGTRPSERVLIGEMQNILSKNAESKLSNPAVIVIGETVRLGKEKLTAALSGHLKTRVA
ncbi:uroporphyrinogen-III C-methyltransferase [Marinilongibacter aquaticus]|uniref:uroporphyrinogen-III C-methyltransferase n=1 Tax=Marinilongibacter aquaticus TaxID=2975157 RepID=UPI0021BDB77F|nr:uroporphyrinogen-III C-methyltransferase [Marinilongibacter aquaticus]UBM57352.1 uroporphyrinogen-III C-methyltransferase [Marinilongibacter aquaticus]